MREKLSSSERAKQCTSKVLANPGTPTTKQWPRANNAYSAAEIISGCPIITFPISSCSLLMRGASRSSTAVGSLTTGSSTGGSAWTGGSVEFAIIIGAYYSVDALVLEVKTQQLSTPRASRREPNCSW